MFEFIISILTAARVFIRSRRDTALEIFALRQQVAVLKRKRPRPVLNSLDRLFWTTLRFLRCRWADTLIIVKPETVIGWHRAGFRLYWRWRAFGPSTVVVYRRTENAATGDAKTGQSGAVLSRVLTAHPGHIGETASALHVPGSVAPQKAAPQYFAPQRAIACNAQRQGWRLRHSRQRRICNLQIPLTPQESESLSLRQISKPCPEPGFSLSLL